MKKNKRKLAFNLNFTKSATVDKFTVKTKKTYLSASVKNINKAITILPEGGGGGCGDPLASGPVIGGKPENKK
jgi:hypothetical protein